MSKGKKKSTRIRYDICLVLIVGIFLSTSILCIVSWIISGETSILLATMDLLQKVLEFATAYLAFCQMIKI